MSDTANKAAIAGFVFVLGVTLSAPVSAQRGTGARGHVPVVHAPARVGTPMNPNFAPISRVPGAAPGLGFDFEHLAAVSRPSANQRRNGRRQQFITPVFFDGGLPLYYPSY